jgi:hypothetical protein
MILAGNKGDVVKREVSVSEGEAKANSGGMSFCETSAKSGAGI